MAADDYELTDSPQRPNNIYSNIPEHIPGEIFEELVQSAACRIERIISLGHTTPKGHWYDQDRDEWIILLKGKARLLFKDRSEMLEMNPGDYIHIPAHRRHRVEYTKPDEETIWLAIHY